MQAFIHHPGPPFSTESVDVREHGNPRPRLTRDGYTERGGSPTTFQIRFKGEKRWRRVYVLQFSNAPTLFIKTQNDPCPLVVVQIHA
jgi:hypothetical protein